MLSTARAPVEPPRRLDRGILHRAVEQIARTDPALRAVVRRHGVPPLWARRPGLATLIRIVLEQQVSLASGRAVYRRMHDALGEVTAEAIVRYGVRGLRRLGVTRQKATYCVAITEAIAGGDLSLRRVARAPVDAARAELQRINGIGPWTADIYLLMALRRPDIWPTGDIALLTALQRLRRLPRRPTVEEAAGLAIRWSPWRAVAARILWHGYLAGSLRSARA
jgi:DNA-3-methyladenine glycosylase II